MAILVIVLIIYKFYGYINYSVNKAPYVHFSNSKQNHLDLLPPIFFLLTKLNLLFHSR